jgi:hypothetical protein
VISDYASPPSRFSIMQERTIIIDFLNPFGGGLHFPCCFVLRGADLILTSAFGKSDTKQSCIFLQWCTSFPLDLFVSSIPPAP